ELRNPPKTIGKPILVQTPHSIFFFNGIQAVVGAVIGGTATAYFVRQEFGAVVKFDVFEPGTVGRGGLATQNIGEIHLFVPERVLDGMSHGKELTFEESD
uniref:Uncharacterized protein n=1 Tax=Salmo trutta TaxID=8032 RepID=A0A673WX15_SALTR